MNQPLISEGKEIAELAKELREMADRMEKNGIQEFGGCFVVIPPQGGDPLKTLILDKNADVAQFWALLKTKCDIALASIDQQMMTAQGGYRR